MQRNSLDSSHPDSETGMSANPAPGLRGRPLHIAWGILRNLPKIMNVLPPFRPKALQQLRERLDIPTRTHETRQPFDLSPALATKVRKFGLEQAVQSVRENGFGQIHDLVPMDFTAQLRETVWRIANAQTGGQANMLFDKDPIFEPRRQHDEEPSLPSGRSRQKTESGTLVLLMSKIEKSIDRHFAVQRHPLDNRPLGDLIRNDDDKRDEEPGDVPAYSGISNLVHALPRCGQC